MQKNFKFFCLKIKSFPKNTMASANFEIKFKNIEHFSIENESEFKLLPKENFGNFQLLPKNNKIFVVNPTSQSLIASFTGEKITYGYDQNEK